MNIRELAGRQIDEYTLVNIIGQGGMSAVYRAYQEELDRHVAIKILSDELAQDPAYKTRFQNEARMSAQLEHAHIVPVYDFGVQDELTYVAMRLLSGTLTDKLYAATMMSLNDVLVMLEQVAKALDYAHSRGIVHRDVKPSNIMFDDTDTAYLVDFGIAKAVQQADTGLTAEHMVLGTPSYMPPELWRGETPSGASDQYALAVVSYQILTGRLPFSADTPSSMMYKHLNDTPPTATDVNPNLSSATATVLTRAMSKDVANRYPLVSNFVNALTHALTAPADANIAPSEPANSMPTMVNQRPVPEQTMPNQAAPRPQPQASPQAQVPRQPSPSRASSASQPKRDSRMPQQQSRPEKQPNTVLMQIAGGSIIGIGLILILLIIALAVVIFLFAPDNPSSNNAETAPTVDIAQAENESADSAPTPLIENRGEPTLAFSPIVTPDTDFVGLSVASISNTQSLISQNPSPARDVLFSPTGAVAAAIADGTIRVWRDGIGGTSTTFNGHVDVVSALDFNGDGSLLVSGGRDNDVLIWDVASGERLLTLNGHTGAIRDVAFSPDSTQIASAAEDGTVRIWNVTTGAQERFINADPTRVLTVDFSTEGGLIASGGRNGRVRLWQVSDGTNIRDFAGHAEEIRSVQFSPDGELLASSSTDNNIILWRLSDGSVVHDLDSERDVFSLAFSPDGSLLASGDRNNDIRLWTVATGVQERILTGHVGWVFGVSFSPDGSTLISSSGDGSVRVWR